LTRAAEKIGEAAARGAQIICLHELFAGEYFCRSEDAELFGLAEAVPGPTTERLAAVAKEKKVALVVSVFERRAAGVYHNTCAILDADGAYVGKYRKMHIPDDPLYYEKFILRRGIWDFEFRHEVCADRRANLLGPVVSGGFADHGDARGAGDFLSDEHRMAPARESGVWGGAVGCLADDTAGACGGERNLCGGGEPRGIRGEAGEGRCGAGVLGNSFVADPFGGGGGGFAGEGRDSGGGVRSGKSEETRRNGRFSG